MRSIQVSASKTYDVRIGKGLLHRLGNAVEEVTKGKTVAIVSDSNVWPLWGEIASESLRQAGCRVEVFLFPAGEESKNGETYLRLLSFLAQHKLTRQDAIIALGGGVVGDLAGFAAATYLRSVPFIQVPTTLLAAVDSSVGGKTAIDLPEGKNLAGAFYQPSLVLCDTDALATVPQDVFLDGCSEVIKYAVLFDRELFSLLEKTGKDFPLEDVIGRCVELKAHTVAMDEFDTGCRMLLNLGHTLGHGVEGCSGYRISHGKAVAIGMAAVARASAERNVCTGETRDRILSLLTSFALPTQCPYTPAQLLPYCVSDKKRLGGTVQMILPREIGDCAVYPLETEQLIPFMEAGM